ncbi:MAG: DUF5681 domain-containing protein [Hyphomicrobiaceae bacterium]|uniref:DUF5681 domain-containing protein n=1 Tax=Pseudorhodoplanes sp. TaxID=1934341 RepID=UPI003D0C6DA9
MSLDGDDDAARPRKDGRFRKGTSGNPRGRPRKKKPQGVWLPFDEKTERMLREDANRLLSFPDGSQRTVHETAIKQLGNAAAKGKPWALRQYFELHLGFERNDKKAYDEFAQTAIEHKLFWTEELTRRKRLGITDPGQLPHPDDIIIDPQTYEVRVEGPATNEQKEFWDLWWGRAQELEEEIRELEEDLKKEPDDTILKDDLEHNKRLLALIPERIKNWPSAKKRSSR